MLRVCICFCSGDVYTLHVSVYEVYCGEGVHVEGLSDAVCHGPVVPFFFFPLFFCAIACGIHVYSRAMSIFLLPSCGHVALTLLPTAILPAIFWFFWWLVVCLWH